MGNAGLMARSGFVPGLPFCSADCLGPQPSLAHGPQSAARNIQAVAASPVAEDTVVSGERLSCGTGYSTEVLQNLRHGGGDGSAKILSSPHHEVPS